MGKKSKRRNNDSSNAVKSQQHHQSNSFSSSSAPTVSTSSHAVARTDFRNIPRWPNDGIEQEFEKGMTGVDGRINYQIDTDDPEHNALTKVLGWCPLRCPLKELPLEEYAFYVRLPFLLQQDVAEAEGNLPCARDHLIEAYKRKDPDVMKLLKETNCQKAIYKASYDKSRCPDLRCILVPLFQKNLASDSNIELLFGKISYVRHLLFFLGQFIAEPPPDNSPASAFLSQFLYDEDSKAAPGPKSCAECCSVSDGVVTYARCTACKTVHYCSRKCQKKHWPIHKPDCLRAQGKDVPQSVIDKAERIKKEREEMEEAEAEKEKVQFVDKFMARFHAFTMESPDVRDKFAHDVCGTKMSIDIPTEHANLWIEVLAQRILEFKVVRQLTLGVYPDGFYDRYDAGEDQDLYGNEGVELEHPTNGARIIVLFDRLFEKAGEILGGGLCLGGGGGGGSRVCCGIHVGGVFVVDRVMDNKKAKWKLVPEPFVSYNSDDNRNVRLVKYLLKAREEAKPVPEGIDLGIRILEPPGVSRSSTPFGAYIEKADYTI